VVRLFYQFLGVLSLVPLGAALVPPVFAHFKSPSAEEAFISVEFLSREAPAQWLDPWIAVSLVSGLIIAVAFSLLMRRASSPASDLRPIWVVLLFALAPISQPVFWLCYLRPRRQPTSNTSLERTREG
jgi:hypothetical protein